MRAMPSVVGPAEPTRSFMLSYTQPMMFMFTVLPCEREREAEEGGGDNVVI